MGWQLSSCPSCTLAVLSCPCTAGGGAALGELNENLVLHLSAESSSLCDHPEAGDSLETPQGTSQGKQGVATGKSCSLRILGSTSGFALASPWGSGYQL